MPPVDLGNLDLLKNLNANIAVLDETGVITSVNRGWYKFAWENNVDHITKVDIGINYLAACKENPEVVEGIRALLNNEMEQYMYEYPCDSPEEERWFLMLGYPIKGLNPGVVLCHFNISKVKLFGSA